MIRVQEHHGERSRDGLARPVVAQMTLEHIDVRLDLRRDRLRRRGTCLGAQQRDHRGLGLGGDQAGRKISDWLRLRQFKLLLASGRADVMRKITFRHGGQERLEAGLLDLELLCSAAEHDVGVRAAEQHAAQRAQMAAAAPGDAEAFADHAV